MLHSTGDEENLVLNLGRSDFVTEPGYPIWNSVDTIKKLMWPGYARELLDDLMPPQPVEFPAQVWIKTPGSQGRGKFRKHINRSLQLPREWDWQEHVDGQEYRIVTVGHRVVQQHLRHGPDGQRQYQWLRMRDVPGSMKIMARRAARRLPGRNVIAWDMILDSEGTPYILEGNTCPGMNPDTADRIKREMARVSQEGVVEIA
jgi:hypothetical protein